MITSIKPEVESVTAEEQQRQAAAMEAEEQQRTEQSKLSGLEERVNRVEKDLGGIRISVA